MAFNVTEFRANLIGDGARPNLFQVSMPFPGTGLAEIPEAARNISFLAKTAQLPGSTVGVAPLYYFGRELKFAGNRTFADWTITVINDEDFMIRDAFENWLDAINMHAANLRDRRAPSPYSYTCDAVVKQYGKTGDAIKDYLFVGMFPTDVAPIELDWGTNDSIEEFSVTLAYQFWESNTTR